MSSKEIKSYLKSARTAIQAKDYETVLKHCEAILDKDPSNYNALVFSGLGYSETGKIEEARQSYRTAIKSHPDQILAYQGLLNLYVKHWKKTKSQADNEELVDVCEKLLSAIEIKDVKKRSEITLNLCNALLACGEFIKVVEKVTSELKQISENVDDTIRSSFYNVMFKVMDLHKQWSVFRKYDDTIEECLQHFIDSDMEKGVVLSHFKTYLSYVVHNEELMQRKTVKILDDCCKLAEQFPDEALPIEVICEALMQGYDFTTLDAESLLPKLKSTSSKYAGIFAGYVELQLENYEEAYKHLSSSMSSCSKFLPGWIALCRTAVILHKYSETRAFARTSLGEYKSIMTGADPWLLRLKNMDEAKFDLTRYLAISLCHSRLPDDLEKGITTFKKLLAMNPKDAALHVGIGEGYISQKKFHEAMQSMLQAQENEQDHESATVWLAFLKTKIGDHVDGIFQLQSLSATPLSMYLLGKSMWDADGQYRKDKKNCFTALVKAAKLDPNHGDTFFLLGHFYAKVQRDSARAKGCYQKAYALDRQHHEAAACLADAYVEGDETDLAIQLYENITKELGSAGGKWAWLRLGLYKLKAKDMSNAIQCFQVALRIDSDDSVCWECLGEGYLQRGSYTAAWKAFDKARQLDPKSVYCQYQIARVKQVQGLHPDAIKEFQNLLTLFPDYVPALKGLGESELLLARQMFHEGRYLTGVEHIENAIHNLVLACTLRRDLCCIWKLLGDSCVLVHSLGNTVVNVSIPSIVMGKDSSEKTVVHKSQMLSLGVQFYIKAIELQSDNGSLWHDLGIAFFRQAENELNEDAAINHSRKALNALKKAVTHDKKNHNFWCSMGVVAASKFLKDPAFAQHCFLTSIKCEQNNVQAWSNLATLYLEHDHVKRAHEAFKVAQSLEPSFTNSWVGQAIIAEAIASEETMDLYRHSTELGIQKHATAGYSSWVTKVMNDRSNRNSPIFKENILNMNAVAVATTQISKACSRNPACAWSSTIHGFLLEYSGLNSSAEKAYEQAYRNVCAVGDDGVDVKRRDIAALNLGRLLCKNGKYKEACTLYHEHSQALEFYDTCGLALSHFKLGEYEEAMEWYQTAGSKASLENEKAEVMVAMAMTYWKMGKKDESKTMLYQCFQNSKPGLQALLSLGVSVHDDALVGAAVGEILKKIDATNDEKEIVDDCLLISAAAKVHGDQNVALTAIQKAIRRNPSSAMLRALLCRLLVDGKDSHGLLSVSKISDFALKLSMQRWNGHPLHQDSELWRARSKHYTDTQLARTRAISSLAAGSPKTSDSSQKHMDERLRQAQKFARMHPYDVSSWKILSCACHAKNVFNNLQGCTPRESDTVTKISKIMSPDKGSTVWDDEMRCWMGTFAAQETTIPNNASSDVKFIKLLQSASATKEKGKLQVILKDITGIMGTTRNPALSSKYFGELLIHQKMFQVARKMFDKSMTLYEDHRKEKIMLYSRILQLAYHLSTNSEAKEMDEAVKRSLAEMVKLDQRSPVSLLLQGLMSRMEKNHRKAKSYFNRLSLSTELISDSAKNAAIWYLYRTLYERNDWTEIEKLVQKCLEGGNDIVTKMMQLLPPGS